MISLHQHWYKFWKKTHSCNKLSVLKRGYIQHYFGVWPWNGLDSSLILWLHYTHFVHFDLEFYCWSHWKLSQSILFYLSQWLSAWGLRAPVKYLGPPQLSVKSRKKLCHFPVQSGQSRWLFEALVPLPLCPLVRKSWLRHWCYWQKWDVFSIL